MNLDGEIAKSKEEQIKETFEKMFGTLEENMKKIVEKMRYHEKYGNLFIPLGLKDEIESKDIQ